MVIVPAETRHIPGILRLLRQVGALHAQGRPDLFVPGAQKYDAPQLEAILRDPLRPIFLAEDGGVLGYCFCQLQTLPGDSCVTARRELYIDDLCVEQTARGRHIGAELYRFVRVWAKEQGVDYITLHVWELPGSAVDFYRHMGLTNRYICMEEKL